MKGFTLIELLITLTIVGLLFSFGFVNFRDYSRRQHLIAVGDALKGDLRLTQSKALAGEIPTGCANITGYNFVVVSTSSYKVTADCDIDRDVKEVILPVDVVSNTPPTIAFKLLGHGTNIAEGEEVAITLKQVEGDETVTVYVTSGGEIK